MGRMQEETITHAWALPGKRVCLGVLMNSWTMENIVITMKIDKSRSQMGVKERRISRFDAGSL